MNLRSALAILMLVGAPAAVAQNQSPSAPLPPLAEASSQLPAEEEQAEERLLIEMLEQIENDPVLRARAKAEAQVPLDAF